ncbi:hypothetical protein LJK87_23215 [Paenibacillus sp. P25]|nr:hypothetical protein LJK87_23215 [Paenibacillus sp. P25]
MVRTKPRDVTPPVTTTDAKSGWHNKEQVVSLTASDAEGSAISTYYSVDDAPYVLGNQATISGEGVHTLRYYSVDARGTGKPFNR